MRNRLRIQIQRATGWFQQLDNKWRRLACNPRVTRMTGYIHTYNSYRCTPGWFTSQTPNHPPPPSRPAFTLPCRQLTWSPVNADWLSELVGARLIVTASAAAVAAKTSVLFAVTVSSLGRISNAADVVYKRLMAQGDFSEACSCFIHIFPVHWTSSPSRRGWIYYLLARMLCDDEADIRYFVLKASLTHTMNAWQIPQRMTATASINRRTFQRITALAAIREAIIVRWSSAYHNNNE